MKTGRLVYLFMPAAILMAFLYAPPAAGLGEASRIVYFHVPLAWGSVLAFAVSGILSIRYLFGSNGSEAMLDMKAHHSAGIGLTFTVLAIISGSIWAKMSWGSYWNWDPRETSIVILLLIYISYFALYGVMSDNGNRGRISSVYLILVMVVVPFFIFVVPRVYPSLHPDPIINAEKKMNMDMKMRMTLLVSAVSFTLLYVYFMGMRNRLMGIEKKIDEKIENRREI